MYKGEVLFPFEFRSDLSKGPVLNRLRSDFQEFVQDLTYLMLVQCGQLPKKVKLEGRAYNPQKNTHVDHRIFTDGTTEVMTGYLNFYDEGISLNDVSFSKYGQELVEFSKRSVEKLLKIEEVKRLNQARWDARPMSSLEALWRKAGKATEGLTIPELLLGMSNAVENSICNQPITKENLGNKHAAGCDDVRFGIIPESARN